MIASVGIVSSKPRISDSKTVDGQSGDVRGLMAVGIRVVRRRIAVGAWL